MSGTNYNETDRIVSRKSSKLVEVFRESNLPEDVVNGHTYRIQESLTIGHGLVLPYNAQIILDAPDLIGTDIIYTASGTLFEVGDYNGIDQFLIRTISVFAAVGTPQIFNVVGTPPELSTIGVAAFTQNIAVYVGFDDLGTVQDLGAFNIQEGFFQSFTTGLLQKNVGSSRIENSGFITNSSASGIVYSIEGPTFDSYPQPPVISRFINTSFTLLNSSAHAFRIDPALPRGSSITIRDCAVLGASTKMFDTSGGTTGTFHQVGGWNAQGTFTSVSQGTQVIGGYLARFTRTGDVPDVYQEVAIIGTAEPSYTTSAVVTYQAGTQIELEGVLYVGDDSGTWSAHRTEFEQVSTAHGLVDGQTVTIQTLENGQYDGGWVVFHTTTNNNTFSINRPYTQSLSGTWSTAPLDQRDPRVLAFNNPGQPDSKYLGCWNLQDNTNTTNFSDTYGNINTTGLTESAVTERFMLRAGGQGRVTYKGYEPISGIIQLDGLVTGGSGSATVYSFVIYKSTNDGNSWSPLDDDIAAKTIELSTNEEGTFTISIPVSLEYGDQLKPQGRVEDVTSKTAAVTSFNMIITA